MSVSLDPRANYKTQASFYDAIAIANGPLTDGKIKKYALAGRYGPELAKRFAAKRPVNQQKVKVQQVMSLLDSLLDEV